MKFDTVKTMQDQTVDQICLAHYGRTDGVTERVLSYNVGLAAKGAILPMGTEIKLPALAIAKTKKLVSLWT